MAISFKYAKKSAVLANVQSWEAETAIKNYKLYGSEDARYWEFTIDDYYRYFSKYPDELTIQELVNTLKSEQKSAGARYIACRFHNLGVVNLSPTLVEEKIAEYAKDWHIHRKIKNELSDAELSSIGADVGTLRYLGITNGYEARKFYELYSKAHVKNRVWSSCYQINQWLCLQLAINPLVKKLPEWVKIDLLQSGVYLHFDRLGDIWKLIPCVKAWKWCNNLPKKIAYRIGKMSLKARILSNLAWQLRDKYCDDDLVGAEDNQQFWSALQYLLKQSAIQIWNIITTYKNSYSFTYWYIERLIEYFAGLEYKSDLHILKEEGKFPSARYLSDYAVLLIDNLLDDKFHIQDVYLSVYGVAGKRSIACIRQASDDQRKWAKLLAFGNPDLIQKICTITPIIAYQQDAENFLKSLHINSALRLLQATTFKYRGEVQNISEYHVRDTGYLWDQIQNKPDLGRVRCWFSVHEALAKAYVAELPNEPLPIPSKWSRLQGLSAIDGSWELEFPTEVATLKYWGKLLGNCVGGYGNAIKSGRSVVFVVKEYGQITHCVEYEGSGNYCRQFLQANNKFGDYELEKAVTQEITKAIF